MSTTHIVRAIRQPLTWLVIVAFALLAMLALESTGAKHAPSAIPLNKVATQHSAPTTPKKHCTDNNGKDNPKNKHCRAPSGT